MKQVIASDKLSFSIMEIHDILRKEILTLQLEPGQKLSENKLSSRFNTSRTPIRNATSMLSHEGLVEVKPKAGTFVSRIDLDMAMQIIYMRIQTECAAMKTLANAPNFLIIKQLEENLSQQKDQLDRGVNDEVFYYLDSSFHQLVMESCNKGKIWQLIQHLDVHYSRYRHLDYIATKEQSVFDTLYQEHLSLFQLIRDNQPSQIQYVLTKHLYGGFLRINTRFESEYPTFFTENSRTVSDILMEIKLMLLQLQQA
jgi:DNA-binding GntR family transcriptional regulator